MQPTREGRNKSDQHPLSLGFHAPALIKCDGQDDPKCHVGGDLVFALNEKMRVTLDEEGDDGIMWKRVVQMGQDDQGGDQG